MPEIVAVENHSSKPITALCSRWIYVQENGTSQTAKLLSDSYRLHPLQPILEADGRMLLNPSESLKESLVKHVLKGGGFLRAGGGRRTREGVEVWFQLDLVLFADGELAGSDPDRYAQELQLRSRAAEYLAKQIRATLAQDKDPSPMLRALENLPHFEDERFLKLLTREARDYLRHLGMRSSAADPHEIGLRNLESRPALPKFYRREAFPAS